ncbi:GTP-binding protein [Desulfosarcina ovata]|uniref:CobW/HypB/UreG nucleotide-binding domain-containing protein n=1 Tax=Desulfosarcina ovata subsp. ovata TaxID=2752305 RepID=A0A5K8AP53_9BACT|nr:GTP-binding protein [Desulfosarcina ovata]BBO93404.1 hypothetical protein DSCOOX_65840 [Desulfosarcina ovata subsp. ovata]
MLLRFVIVAGPPSAGKTSVMRHTLGHLLAEKIPVAACKIDCPRQTPDAMRYRDLGIPVAAGVSGCLCPGRFYMDNLKDVWWWAQRQKAEVVVLETAGLCHRCVPWIVGGRSIFVIDHRRGLDMPTKFSPLIAAADIVTVTKADQVCELESRIFRRRTAQINPWAPVINVNGLTGRGSGCLGDAILSDRPLEKSHGGLAHPMPAATCACCTNDATAGHAHLEGPTIKRRLCA